MSYTVSHIWYNELVRRITKYKLKKNPMLRLLVAEDGMGKPRVKRYVSVRKPSVKEKTISWHKEYLSYINGNLWKAKKLSFWNERPHKCGCCGKELEFNQSALHHRTYKRFRREDKNDLVFLCHDCHHIIHYYPDGTKKPTHSTALAMEERKLREKYTSSTPL